MSKKLKIIITVIIVIAVLLVSSPFIFYGGIVIANNNIANNLEKDLKKAPLPENTVLVDSISVAAKMTGNGNGMQYYGAIVVESELSEEELKAHYEEYGNYIFVRVQENEYVLNDDYLNNHTFDNLEEGKTYYCIESWEYNKISYYENSPTLLDIILNFDIRAH